MRLKHYSLEKLKKEIIDSISRHLDLNGYRLFFFGSRVTGRRGDERSDIDVGIEGPEAVPSLTVVRIKEELENLPTLYTIELVDFKKVDPDFKKVAKQKIEPIL